MGNFVTSLIGMLPLRIKIPLVIIGLSIAGGLGIHWVASEGQVSRISHLEKLNQELVSKVAKLEEQADKLKETVNSSVPKTTLDAANTRIIALENRINVMENEISTSFQELITPKTDVVRSFWNPWGDRGPWFKVVDITQMMSGWDVIIRSSQWPDSLSFDSSDNDEPFTWNNKQYILKVGKIKHSGVELSVTKKP